MNEDELPDGVKLTVKEYFDAFDQPTASTPAWSIADAAAKKAYKAGRDSRASDFGKQYDALVAARSERDAALEQVRALIAAWEYREDWEARDAETNKCGKCSWDSGPYTIECEEHNPDMPMEAAIAYCKVK